jgi:hypothetical protein
MVGSTEIAPPELLVAFLACASASEVLNDPILDAKVLERAAPAAPAPAADVALPVVDGAGADGFGAAIYLISASACSCRCLFNNST